MKSSNLITITSAVVLFLNTSCTKPPAAETSTKLDVPPEEIIKKGAVLIAKIYTPVSPHQMTSYKIGTTMVSTGGLIPEGTTLYPVRMQYRMGTYIGKDDAYFFRDEFGEWECNLKGWDRVIRVSQ